MSLINIQLTFNSNCLLEIARKRQNFPKINKKIEKRNRRTSIWWEMSIFEMFLKTNYFLVYFNQNNFEKEQEEKQEEKQEYLPLSLSLLLEKENLKTKVIFFSI